MIFIFVQLFILNGNNCVEQMVPPVVRLSVTRVTKTHSDRIRNFMLDSKISKRRQDKYIKVSFCSFVN